MTRSEMINIIKDWAAPISTFTDIDNFEDYKNLSNDRYSTIEESSIDVLMDILLNPPTEEEIAPVSLKYFTSELVDALSYIGKKHTKHSLKKLEEILNLSKSRSAIINVIGGLKDEDGIAILEGLLKEELSDDEIIHLASALGEIGGTKAKEILMSLDVKYKDRPLEVLRGIEIYLN